MDSNSDLMNVLVEAKQSELRHSARPILPGHEPGSARRWMGRILIHLGERIGGTPRIQAPAHSAKSLAMQ